MFVVLFSLFKTFILRKTALFCFAADPCNSMTLKDGMEYLIPQLDIFIMDGEKLQCFSDFLKAIEKYNVDSAHTSMISEVK